MTFTVLSHACLLVEAGGIRLLTDPWLVGSCYWRSWWNFPRPHVVDLSDVNYVYLTHHHWDHFHGPTLRRLPSSATILLPKAPTRHMLDDMREFGFGRIEELPHGRTLTLAGNVALTSYHYARSLDSVLVVDDGETVLLDMNDCKLSQLTLRQVTRRHPRIDFLFRSHSSASPYPHGVESADPRDLELRQNEDYLADFVRTAEAVRPRYAIPFASNACFLHREAVQYNDEAVSPLDVQAFFDRQPPAGTECVVMLPGSSWDSVAGFTLAPHDAFDRREAYLAAYTFEVAPTLQQYYREEDAVTVDFAVFERYFSGLLQSLPWFSRAFFRPRVVFEATGVRPHYFVVDFARRALAETTAEPHAWDVLIRVHPAVLKDCLQKRMFTVLWPSRRMTVRLRAGALRDFFVLGELFPLYDQGYLPLRRNLNRRFIGAALARWREAIDYVVIAWRMLTAPTTNDALAAAVPKV